MLIEPKILTVSKKKLIGKSMTMSFIENKTFELFSDFMPRRQEIKNNIGTDIYEIMVYDDIYFKKFKPTNSFEKWATLEVSNTEAIAEGMKIFNLESGLYAVFQYKGLPKDFGTFMSHIMNKWLPQSQYKLDSRPHFNILGDNYKKHSPESEEAVYIPIKSKLN